MRRLVCLLCAALLAPAAAQAAQPPASQPTATGAGGAASTVDPYATRAAIKVLRDGGNAVDAAVAAAAVLGVVEPYSSGIGGGGFMVLRTADGQTHTIDGRETAPRAFGKRSLVDRKGEPLDFEEAVTSGLGVGVPGTPATWRTALKRFGTRGLPGLLGPAIRLARRGFVVDATLEQQTRDNRARFRDFPATAKLYLPKGRPIQAGKRLRNPGLARSMALMARKGVGRGFYRGAVARDVVATVRRPPVRRGAKRVVRPGRMSTRDIRAYRAKGRPPTTTDYRGLTLVGMPPPSSGGTTVAEIMNILEALGEPGGDGALVLHRFVEASRLAFADRGGYVGDPDQVDVPVGCLTSQAFADRRAALVPERASTEPAEPAACPDQAPVTASTASEGPNTTHLTVADAKGNVVAYTFTIEQTGGSGIVVPGRGFLLNNELTDFDFEPGLQNSPAPGKRPRSSMAPTIVLRDGAPVLALGSPGGSSIITTVAQLLVNVYERGMTLPEAMAAPRVSQRGTSPESEAEPAFIRSPEGEALTALGHELKPIPELGAATAIGIDGDTFQAAAEPERRGGGAAAVVSP